MMISEKLSKLGITLPPPPSAAGLYKPVLISGNQIYFSGHLPILSDGSMITGKVGHEMTVEEGKEAARAARDAAAVASREKGRARKIAERQTGRGHHRGGERAARPGVVRRIVCKNQVVYHGATVASMASRRSFACNQ